jgi:hypothetical protein
MTWSDSPALFIFPIPAVNFWQRIQPLAPLEPGLYGDFWQGTLTISGNNATEVSALAQRTNTTVLALDTGGFSLTDAFTLQKTSPEHIRQAIISLPPENRPSQVYLPSWLDAQKLELGLDSTVGEIQVVSLAEFQPAPFGEENRKLSSILKIALRLSLAQSALWVLPLLIFGWQSLLVGLGSILLAGMFNGLLWQLLSFSHLMRAATVSGLLAILMIVGFFFLEDLSTLEISLRMLAVLLTSLWLSLTMNGLKP